jgi:hypothetical protein
VLVGLRLRHQSPLQKIRNMFVITVKKSYLDHHVRGCHLKEKNIVAINAATVPHRNIQ